MNKHIKQRIKTLKTKVFDKLNKLVKDLNIFGQNFKKVVVPVPENTYPVKKDKDDLSLLLNTFLTFIAGEYEQILNSTFQYRMQGISIIRTYNNTKKEISKFKQHLIEYQKQKLIKSSF